METNNIRKKMGCTGKVVQKFRKRGYCKQLHMCEKVDEINKFLETCKIPKLINMFLKT